MSLPAVPPASRAVRAARGACCIGLDLLVLCATSFAFAGVLTSLLSAERLGWMWPLIAYDYTRVDVVVHAVLASVVVMPALLLMGRLARVQASPRLQAACFALATLVVIRLGPPDAQVFGTTWTQGEITVGLFLLQWPIIVPLTAVAVPVRDLLRRLSGLG
ncbi:hypothetical protein [Stenotrophomonas sp.]|uniref:hypothetical protein n=1 Tax=Stenotrophomonas sp. TaxID=69392 RepID=UPI002FC864DD